MKVSYTKPSSVEKQAPRKAPRKKSVQTQESSSDDDVVEVEDKKPMHSVSKHKSEKEKSRKCEHSPVSKEPKKYKKLRRDRSPTPDEQETENEDYEDGSPR